MNKIILAMVFACFMFAPGSSVHSLPRGNPGQACEDYLIKQLSPTPSSFEPSRVTFDDTEGLHYVTATFSWKSSKMIYICAVRNGEVIGAKAGTLSSKIRISSDDIHRWLGTYVENSRELDRSVREFKTGSAERAATLKSEMASWHSSSYVPATRGFGASIAAFNDAYRDVKNAKWPNDTDAARLRRSCEGLKAAVNGVLASGAIDSAPDPVAGRALERFYRAVLDAREACLANRTFTLESLLAGEVAQSYNALATRFSLYGLRP